MSNQNQNQGQQGGQRQGQQDQGGQHRGGQQGGGGQHTPDHEQQDASRRGRQGDDNNKQQR
jgi:hypothetical protein